MPKRLTDGFKIQINRLVFIVYKALGCDKPIVAARHRKNPFNADFLWSSNFYFPRSNQKRYGNHTTIFALCLVNIADLYVSVSKLQQCSEIYGGLTARKALSKVLICPSAAWKTHARIVNHELVVRKIKLLQRIRVHRH